MCRSFDRGPFMENASLFDKTSTDQDGRGGRSEALSAEDSLLWNDTLNWQRSGCNMEVWRRGRKAWEDSSRCSGARRVRVRVRFVSCRGVSYRFVLAIELCVGVVVWSLPWIFVVVSCFLFILHTLSTVTLSGDNGMVVTGRVRGHLVTEKPLVTTDNSLRLKGKEE
ncbi:hypothetical protein B0T20DRAFT_155860 [Sordaria brevicollis]|uniref:Transmembrane protein n=1 Tax=Sordaria brevicollis TaxID=83679 RepID=A0AAE0UE66_SORBR|nr:hypothetical protein B0T20DRAFT_155860 [Sordaria brevicollis]